MSNFQLSTFNLQVIRVVIIDDHKIVVEGLERLINETENIRVIGTAYSASGCWGLLSKTQTDVALLDIGLPDGNGINLCKSIKEKYPNIKILMLTSYNELYTINRALDAGADGYLLKNSMSEEIIEGIKSVVSGKKFLCEEASVMISEKPDISKELTRREIELLQLIVEGLTLQELADKMNLGVHTIRSYRKNLNLKLDVHNTAQLIQKAKMLKMI